MLLTDSSTQTVFPQGKNQEGVPLTQTEREGGGALQYKVGVGGGMSADSTIRFVYYNVSVRDAYIYLLILLYC